MLSHMVEHGVLVVTVRHDPGVAGRAQLSELISDLVHAHRPSPVVIVLGEQAIGLPAVSAVLRAHRMCSQLGIPMSVVTDSAAVSHLFEANAYIDGNRLIIHSRKDTATTAAFPTATAAAAA